MVQLVGLVHHLLFVLLIVVEHIVKNLLLVLKKVHQVKELVH